VQGVWAVHHRSPDRDLPTMDGALLHEYLVLSMADATMVLKSGETLAEVTEQCEFVKNAPSLAVGNLFECARIAQVPSSSPRHPATNLLPIGRVGTRRER
jgi:hypothetical protein